MRLQIDIALRSLVIVDVDISAEKLETIRDDEPMTLDDLERHGIRVDPSEIAECIYDEEIIDIDECKPKKKPEPAEDDIP